MLHRAVSSAPVLDLEVVEAERLLRRICVRPPYFALQAIEYRDRVLQATVACSGPRGQENGPMPGAELSRHAAIAGLSVAAMTQTDDQRRYYLAQQATYQGFVNDVPHGSPVHLRAELIELDKRQVRSKITVSALGQPVAEVEVLYTVLTDMAFARLFRNRQRPEFKSAELTELAPLPSGTVCREGLKLSRAVPEVPAESCAGHFDGYPAMPVAILMGQLAQLAGEAFGGRFHISSATVQANDFCWAGEAVRFEVSPEQVTALRTGFHCEAHTGERLVGQMKLVLEHRT